MPVKSIDLSDPPPPSLDKDAKSRPAVHYPDSVLNNRPPPPPHTRTESFDMLSSRTPSFPGTDDEFDNYDWSGEEDLVDEEARFEKKMGTVLEQKPWGFTRIITTLFSSLIGSTFLAALLVTPAILVHFLWYKPHPTEHRRYVKNNVQSWLFWVASNLVISWYLALLVDIVPAIIRLFLSAFWGHVSESIKSRIELYDSVKDTFKPVLYAASIWVSSIIIFTDIYGLYDPSNPESSQASYLYRIDQVVQFIFFLALVICAQRMLSHAIAFAFHRTAYKERINAVREALAVIERLRRYHPKLSTPRGKAGSRTPVFGAASSFSEKEHYKFLSNALRNITPSDQRARPRSTVEDASDIDTDEHAMDPTKAKGKNRVSYLAGRDSARSSPDEPSPQSGPSTPPILPRAEVHHQSSKSTPVDILGTSSGDASPTLKQAARVLKHAVLHDARNLRGDNHSLRTLSWNVNSSHEAKRLARSIYNRFKQRHRSYLLPSDFYPVFPDHQSAEAAFRVFDKDNNGDISRSEIKTTVLKVYKERRFLSRSMRDVSQAQGTLDRIMLFFALVILFFISLSVFGVNITKSLTSVYSIFVAASFIFKRAASSAFDAIMFLFVTHPFDTGDRCVIDDENLVAKKVGLFATVFARSDGSETYYFNSQLFSKFITNVRRSDKTFESLLLQVAWRTPLEKLDALEKCLNDWLSTEENRWFEPSTNITFQHIVYQRYLELSIGIGHNGKVLLIDPLSRFTRTPFVHRNWQDWGLRLARKTAFHAAVQHYCRELGIVGYEAPLPIVFANASTESYDPSRSPSIFPEDEAMPESEQQTEVEETERKPKDVKPTLGFVAPVPTRPSNLTRARKSKSKKTALRAAMTEG
ncbi:hypothetical protein AX17_001279 [Amanita inopinata Kibby_2008]|nr:hypothetical protein AX17_001279 [Amanita inopinata Kibby_2008]